MSTLDWGNPDPAKEFAKILSDFRQSYVLTYTPTGVNSPGWHAIKVDVAGHKYKVLARSGYFGG